jgi:hypothetical protein
MDDRRRIKTIHFHEKMTCVADPNKWVYTPQKKYKRVQDICWKILQKFGALKNVMEMTSEITTIHLDQQSFLNRVLQQQEDILHYYNKTKVKIYMGNSDFDKAAMSSRKSQVQYFSFHCDPPQFMGIDIHVIPHMEGVLVVPA